MRPASRHRQRSARRLPATDVRRPRSRVTQLVTRTHAAFVSATAMASRELSKTVSLNVELSQDFIARFISIGLPAFDEGATVCLEFDVTRRLVARRAFVVGGGGSRGEA